eukprot:1097890-Rhodomonas_salina.1
MVGGCRLKEEEATGPLNSALEPYNSPLSAPKTLFFLARNRNRTPTRCASSGWGRLYAELAECGRVVGVLNVQISVSGADGHVTELHALADTLVPDPLELVDEAVSCL